MSDEAAGGFLGRWSQRKRDAQAGRPLAEPPLPALTPAQNEAQRRVGSASQIAAEAPALPGQDKASTSADPNVAPPAGERELPTLADAQQLTPASDFQPFMSQGVPSEVRNTAMKKLFTDPHFNVMDGLDIYIGDYNTPDPLPPEMLRKMVGAQFLGLWDDEAPAATADPSPEAPQPEAPTSAAHQSEHDHTDLRLQPNPTSADPEPEPRPG